MAKRQSNRPDRRICPIGLLTTAELLRIAATARYVGSPNHKLRAGDYGFVPPSNPRASKSLCDDKRALLKSEARDLMMEGIRRGMISRVEPGQFPKYIWAVDNSGEVFEAKTKPGQETDYHGYRLGDDERQMRAEVLKEWNSR